MCIQQFPELKFKYVEEDHPEEFFIPYVWMLTHTRSGLYWPARNIRLRHSSSSDCSEPMTPATPTTPVSSIQSDVFIMTIDNCYCRNDGNEHCYYSYYKN